MGRVRNLVALLLLFVAASSQAAEQAWWNEEWNFRKEINLDLSPAAANITGSPAEVPVLIRLHLGNFDYFADTKPDGADLRFVAGDDKTPLKFHIERYDATNNLAFLWVKVPRLTAGASTKIFLYYGNPKAPAGADVPGTYDANQVAVYHFTAEGAPTDATAYANNATTPATFNAASLIGGGATLTGTAAITAPATASLRLLPDKGLTLSGWVRIGAPQTNAYLFELADQNRQLVLGIDGTHVFANVVNGTQVSASAQSSDQLVANAWHYLAMTVGAGRVTLYIDGTEVAATPADLAEIGGALTIGGSAKGANFLTAEIDEVEIANVARSADFVQAAARSQGQEAPLVAYGADAQKQGASVSYFAVTMQNVTVDGWVVIIILAVMFVIAVLIM